MIFMASAGALLLAYLVGAIPTAYLIVKAVRGEDIRTLGSGNVGATNVGRLMGSPFFFLVLFIDLLKGVAGVWLGSMGVPTQWGPEAGGAMAIIGHVFPVYLGFRGGKAVATGLGVFLCLAPVATFVSLVVFIVVKKISGYVSLGSLVAAVVLMLCCWALYLFVPSSSWVAPSSTTAIVSSGVCALIYYTHRSNIVRLIRGSEPQS